MSLLVAVISTFISEGLSLNSNDHFTYILFQHIKSGICDAELNNVQFNSEPYHRMELNKIGEGISKMNTSP